MKYLFQINAFLIEIPFLENLKENQFKSNLKNIRFNMEFFKSFTNLSDSITFGILNETRNHEHIKNIINEKVGNKTRFLTFATLNIKL